MKICAYCKTCVYPQDRKCPSCGSTVFIADAEEPQAAPRAEESQAAPDGIYREAYHNAYQDAYAAPRHAAPYVFTQTTYAQARSPRNRWIGLLLCVFGGYLGLHRFYAGKVGTGILYLCSGGLFGIGIVVDGLSLLFGSFRDGQGRLMS